MWNDERLFILEIDYFSFLKIISSDKLKNSNKINIWEVIEKWIEYDYFNRMTYYKPLFKNYLQFNRFTEQDIENIFQSRTFKLLPNMFQKELNIFVKNFCYKIEQKTELENLSLKFANEANIIKPKHILACIGSHNGVVKISLYKNEQWVFTEHLFELLNLNINCNFELIGNKNNFLLAIGGIDNKGNTTNSVCSRDISFLSTSWVSFAPMNKRRCYFSSIVLNDTVFVFGGVLKNDYKYTFLKQCECYKLQQKIWLTIGSMKLSRAWSSAAIINGYIYIAGGVNESFDIERSVEKYDPQIDVWSCVAPMNSARKFFALTSFAGRLWAIGGLNDELAMAAVESYDPVTDTWREEAPLTEPRYGHAAIEFNNELHVINGKMLNLKKNFNKNKLFSRFL